MRLKRLYRFLPLACANALPETDLVRVDDRPSRKAAEALRATLALVTLLLLDLLAMRLPPSLSCLACHAAD